jgi:hypothetical protein
VVLDIQVHVHANWPTALLGEVAEKSCGPGEQGESAQQICWQAKIGKRGPAGSRAIERKSPAEHLRVHSADRLEKPQVRSAQAFSLRDRQQHRGSRVGDLVNGVPEARDEHALFAGSPHRGQRQFVISGVIGGLRLAG